MEKIDGLIVASNWPKPPMSDHAWRTVQRINQWKPLGLMSFDGEPVKLYDVCGLTETGIIWGSGVDMLPWYRP